MQEKKRKQAETERKRAEVRARLEEASKAKKAKKGFMTPDRKKKLRVSPLFVSSLLNLVAWQSERSLEISSLKARSRQAAADLLSHFSLSLMETVLMLRQVYKSMFYIASISLPHWTSVIDKQVEFLAVDFYRHCPIARHNLLPLVVRAAGQYRDNPLCTLCAPIFSRNISRNGHIHFSITFSYSPRRPSPSFNVLFSSRRRGASETFPSLSRLFTFTLWSRLTFAILFPSSRNILQNIHAPSPSAIHVSLHAPSRTFPVAVHKVSRVYADYLLKILFASAGPRRHVIFP